MVLNQKVVTAGLGLLFLAGALSANAYDGEKLAKDARVTMTEARDRKSVV